MGKMKQVYMEVVQEDGQLPDGFSLAEYLHKKQIENAEWEENEKNMQSKTQNSTGEHGQDGSNIQAQGKTSENKDTEGE